MKICRGFLLALLTVIFSYCAKISVSVPTTKALGRMDLEASDDMIQRAFSIDNLPCQDEKDPYHCMFEIIENEACTRNKFQMARDCRYSCNFC